MIIDYPWYFVLFCLLLGLLYAFVLYGRSRVMGRWRWPLFAARTLAVSTIAFLLLAPMIHRRVTERQKPLVVLATDRSQSVVSSADSAFTLSPLAQRLQERCDVVEQQFGNEEFTDIGTAIATAADEGDVAAMVLLSDGIHNRGTSPTTVAAKMSFPVFTIAVGDTTLVRDAAIANLHYNRIAFLGNSFVAELTLKARKMKGEGARLTLRHGGKVVGSQEVRYADDDFSTTIAVELPADQAGMQVYDVDLSVLEGEASHENNHRKLYIEVIDSRQKVLVLGRAPHPDLGAIKQAIDANPNYEARVVLMADLPKERLKAEDYGMVVLHNLPSTEYAVPEIASSLPQMYVIGAMTDYGRFNALRTGVEVESKLAGRTNEATAIHRQGFSQFNLDEASAMLIEQLPPLSVPAGIVKMQPSVQALFSAGIGSIDSRQPLVATSSQGGVRRAFVCGEGLWRWRLANYEAEANHEAVDRLISQMVGYVSQQAGRDRLRVEAERGYLIGEPIVLRAQLYNEVYELTNQAAVELKLEGGALPQSMSYSFVPEGNAYRLVVPDLGEGVYRYVAHTSFNGHELSAEGSFAVEALGLEQGNLTADHSLLATISLAGGGTMMRRADWQRDEELWQAVVDSLGHLKPTLYTHTRYAELLHLPWVLVALLLLLCLEWAVRKYFASL